MQIILKKIYSKLKIFYSSNMLFIMHDCILWITPQQTKMD